MRRITTSLLLGLGVLTSGISASAQTGMMSAAGEIDRQFASSSTAARNNFTIAATESLDLKVLQAGSLNATKKTAQTVNRRAVRSTRLRSADINGYYVGTYSTLANGSFDGGGTMKVVPDTDGDSVTIQSFWNGCSVRACLDAASSTVTIPSQYVMTDESLGALNIAAANHSTGAPEYSEQITGVVASDGTIDFSEAWWGVYVQSGANKDRFVGAYHSMLLQKPSGTMMYKNSSNQQAGYYVVINQTSPNTLAVTNIFNRGLVIEIKLNRDRTAEINNQVAFINSSGSWTTIKCVEFNEAGNLTKYSPVIVTDQADASNNTTLRWTDWSLLNAQASSYAGRLTDAVLTADAPFSYPELSVSDFEGDGTEANPYLISSLDHLILLADKVNNDENRAWGVGSSTYTRTYLGKHFAITADIDMQGYQFDAIGNTYYQRFAGSLDGRGHTIKGLNVNGEQSYYSGLFGVCDTTTVLKNIVLDSPVVTGNYYSVGGLAAWCIGSIKNVTVNNPSINGARSGNGAVAGIVSGSMKDCHVTGGTVMAGGFIGGVAGEVHGGAVNCSAVGTKVYITGSGSPAGGVFGNILDADASNLWFSGLLSYANLSSDGGQIIGGVAGLVQNVALSNSFSAGVMRAYASESQIGGVVGILSSGTVENCYSSGVVHGYTRMGGGIIGQIQLGSSKETPRVTNCYTSATVEVETYQYDKNNCNEVIGKIIDGSNPELTNIYYDKQVVNFGSTRFGTTTSFLTSAQGPTGFPAEAWTFTSGAYPRIKALADTEAAMFSASAVDMSEGDSFKKISNNTPLTALGQTRFLIAKGTRLSTEGYYSKVVDNKTLEIGDEFGIDTLYVVNGDVQTYHFINIAPIPFEGEGTAESPFLIKNKADMIALSEATTGKRQTFEGMYFAITGDIDMELDPAFKGINAEAAVGAASVKFQGVLDGQGHTIDNILIPDRVTWSKAPTATTLGTIDTSKSYSYGGLVGRLGENGVIKNLNIGAGSKFEFYGTSGAFVGSHDGLVENCRNYADVKGYSCWIGGISGMVNKGGRIINCYNSGNITSGYANVGGIAGVSNGIIENCANTGDIAATALCTNYSNQRQRAGGISGGGNGHTLKNCVNYGTVYAMLNNAGGITSTLQGTSTAGSGNDDLISCLSLGNVYCGNPATCGAVIGLKGSKNIENTYFDAQLIGIKGGENSDVENITGPETSRLISGEPLEGLSTDLWNFAAGQYPTLKQFADEPKIAAARVVIAKVAEGQIATDLISDVELTDGATWSMAKGTEFKINGSVMTVPRNVTTVVSDTLIALNKAGVRRPIFVRALPAMPLEGEGTAESPYLINKTDDWAALSTYISNTAMTLEGEYVKMTADLDFAGKNPVKIGADGVTPLAATFDGGNHTIKGIALKSKANMSSALFGTVEAAGTVKNLIVEGTVSGTHTYATSVVDKLYGTLANVTSKADITSNKTNAAGVVGNAYTGALLDNVVFAGSVSASGANIGGIVSTAAAGVTFKNCRFEGKLSHTASLTKATSVNIGGLVATAGASTFDNCRSDGEITVASTDFAQTVAGIVGTAAGAKGNGLYTFTGCSNATPITAGGKIAGIVAGFPTSSATAANAQYVLTDCFNEGDIIAEATKAMTSCPTAGLVAAHTPGSSFTRCYNTGTIISNMNTYAAGISGYSQGTPSADSPVTFTDCYNSGSIVADGNQGGGIAGYLGGNVIMTGCYNTGDIEGNRMLGGITSAFTGAGPQMINCYNTGNITAKADRAGGLIAWGAPTNGLVEGCWNVGAVQSLSTVQSDKSGSSFEIAGLAGQSAATFKNCYNAGSVKGLARVAGLVATPLKNQTQFENCYNAGVIEAPADSCGSIVGVNITAGKIWTAANTMTGCYYIDSNKCDNDQGFDAKAVSVKELASLDIDGFDCGDDYTYPVVNGFEENETAMFNAAQLILSGEDTTEKVTTGFNVGGTPVVKWTSDCADLAFDCDAAAFVKTFTGKIIVTATAGELTKTYELNADNAISGVDSIDGDSADVVSRTFFTTSGVEVPQPQTADGQVYVVVEKLSDGSTRIIKKVNYK